MPNFRSHGYLHLVHETDGLLLQGLFSGTVVHSVVWVSEHKSEQLLFKATKRQIHIRFFTMFMFAYCLSFKFDFQNVPNSTSVNAAVCDSHQHVKPLDLSDQKSSCKMIFTDKLRDQMAAWKIRDRHSLI